MRLIFLFICSYMNVKKMRGLFLSNNHGPKHAAI